MTNTRIKEGYKRINNKLVKDSELPDWYSDYIAKQRKDHAESYKMFNLKFQNDRDRTIIDWLVTKENKTEYIRQLILADIEKDKQK